MRDLLFSTWHLLLDLLFPYFCVGCHREGSLLCPDCFQTTQQPDVRHCPFCATVTKGETCLDCRSHSALDGVWVAVAPSERVSTSIHRFKYSFYIDLGHILADFLVHTFLSWYASTEDLVLMPVPLHASRMTYRSFNQAEVMARDVARLTNVRLYTRMLGRPRKTLPQAELTRTERLRNVHEAFVCSAVLPKGTDVIVVDDVLTTGSTLEACARELKRAGARSVWGLVVSHGTKG